MNKNNYYETDKCILTAISELMVEIPLSKISVTKVCDKAGLNRSTFYSHYNTLEDAIACVDQSILNGLRTIVSGETIIGEAFFLNVFTYINKNKEYFTGYYRCGNSLDFMKYFVIQYDECKELAGKYVAGFWSAGLNAVIKDWLLTFPNKTPEEIARVFTYNILHIRG